MRKFAGVLLSAISSLWIAVLTMVQLVLAVVFWALSPDAVVSVRVVLPVAALAVFVIAVLAVAAYRCSRDRNTLPKVLKGMKANAEKGFQCCCFLEPSDLFSYNAQVSFYWDDNGFEQFVGTGFVRNIQENGRILVVMTDSPSESRDRVEKIAASNSEALRSLRVKPTVLQDYGMW